jgi:CRISPR-associated endonuclease/helicase Cas3
LDFSYVLRQKDLIELFDTTPDLAGSDIDVSRFIREADEHDVFVFWRDIPQGGPDPDEAGPTREELCSVPISKDLKEKTLWSWNHLEKRWIQPRSIYPGLILMLDADQGGYSNELGWTGKDKTRVTVLNTPGTVPESNDDDKNSYKTSWQTIDEHTELVRKTLIALMAFYRSALEDTECEALLDAACWHDAGKAHPQFQQAIPDGAPDRRLWGKSALPMKPYERKGFRHELASALAMLNNSVSDLAVYLAAAHHGKVRLSIRSLPHEKRPLELERRFARGIWDGDILPEAKLCEGVQMPQTVLKLTYMELGEDPKTGPSWLARMLKLREDYGPFRLAFLETLLRIADWRASSTQEDDSMREEP